MRLSREPIVANINLAHFWSIVVCRLSPCLCLQMFIVASSTWCTYWAAFFGERKTNQHLSHCWHYDVTPLTMSFVDGMGLLVFNVSRFALVVTTATPALQWHSLIRCEYSCALDCITVHIAALSGAVSVPPMKRMTTPTQVITTALSTILHASFQLMQLLGWN